MFDFPEAMKQLRQLGFRASRPIEASVMTRYEQIKKGKTLNAVTVAGDKADGNYRLLEFSY
jgi:hypothetical protein